MWPMWCKELIVDFPAERTTLVWPSEVEGSGGSKGSEVFYVNMCQYVSISNANECKWHEEYWYMMIYDDQQWSVDRIISTCKISTFAILWYFMIFENVCFTSGRLWYKVMKRLLPPLQQTPERSERLPRNFAQTALGTPWNILERLGTSWTGSIQTTKLALRIT